TPADYGDLVSLYLWGRPNLSAEQTATVLAGLSPQANQVSAWSYEQMRGVLFRMDQAGLPADVIHALPLVWLENRDVRTLENVDQLGWLFSQLQHRQELGPQEFSVRWTGLVRAPTDGTYMFSICPLDLNFQHQSTFRHQITKIWLGEQQILDSSQGGWTYQATPVALKAQQAAPLRVELSFACSSEGVIDARPAVALLSWEAPGLSKQLVPSSALATPDGSQRGLEGAYLLKTGGQEVNLTRIDPQLNFIWYHQSFVISPLDDLRARLAEQLYAVATSESTLVRWEQDEQANPERWQAHWAFLESLDVARQKSWAQVLAARPVLLADCANWAAANLYSRCRIGAPDEALQLIGQWAQAHADDPPALAVDFYPANREVCRELARRLVWQYPPHFEPFEQEYLMLADGVCALPVAYTLAYGYRDLGRTAEWIDKLEARLADEQLTGDRRVNWLLARAQAEEIRYSPANQHWFTADRFLAGRGWIEEASLVAQSEPVRLRVYRELVARLMVDERVAAAHQLVDIAAQRCRSAESTTALAQWRSELDAVEQAFQTRRQRQETEAQNAYVQQLRTRHQRAVAQGDEAASSRYQELLSAAGGAQ
ncbi:MAG: PA14 domain-containing protein, partial [Pirellulaceae bacterium]